MTGINRARQRQRHQLTLLAVVIATGTVTALELPRSIDRAIAKEAQKRWEEHSPTDELGRIVGGADAKSGAYPFLRDWNPLKRPPCVVPVWWLGMWS